MIVYVEYVLADNLLLDAFLAYVSCLLLRVKPSVWRIALSAFVGTALVFPFLYIQPTWARIVYKLGVLIAVCLPLSDSLKMLRKNLVVYALCSAACGGMYYLVCGVGLTPRYGVVQTRGGMLAIVSACSLVVLYLMVQLRGLVIEHKHRKNAVKLELAGRHGVRFVNGYYDSGNTVTAPNGRGILFLSPSMRQEIVAAPTEDDVVVRTVAGKTVVNLYKIETVKIFFRGDIHTIHQVNVAYSQQDMEYDALVPYNL